MSRLQSKAIRLPSFCILLSAFCIASSALAYDVYVAKDGDDNNSGLTRAEAKATIAAGYAVLEGNAAVTVGARLILGDGEWTSTDFGSTLVLSNGWSLVGEHARDKTILKSLTAGFQFFNLATGDTAVRGLTIDYNRSSVTYKGTAINLNRGTLDDCEFRNYFSNATGASNMLFLDTTEAKTITNCVFRSCQITYHGGIIYTVNAQNSLITHCQFISCAAGTSGHDALGIVMFKGTKGGTVRNCLFLRNTVYGANSSYLANGGSIAGAGGSTSNMTLENCTFAECRIVSGTADTVAGNRTTKGSMTIRNCLAFGNTNNNGPIGFVTKVGSISYSAADVEAAGTGNVLITAANTAFRNVREGRYIPLTGPALNAGTSLGWMTGAKDLLGTDRIVGSGPDIGCFENSGVEPTTYYVAKDGDDANSGLTRAEAKATLAAGYALLSGYDETLVLGDGEWATSDAIVLSNGWTLVSENGREATTIAPAVKTRAFSLASRGTCVRDITVNFKRNAYDADFHGALANNPQGVFDSCAVSNLYAYKVAYVSLVDITASSVDPVFTNCLFSNSNASYRRALFWIDSGKASFIGCSFIECDGYNRFAASSRMYFNYGMVYFVDSASLIRNCLFLRCSAYGIYDTGSSTYGSVVSCKAGSGVTVENSAFIDCKIVNSLGGALSGAAPNGASGGTAINCFGYGSTNSTAAANLMPSFTYSHCASDTQLAGEGNVVLTDSNFRYRRPAADDYTVKSGPTIDAGTNRVWMTGALDLMGRPRITGNIVDIGCFELEVNRATRFMVR